VIEGPFTTAEMKVDLDKGFSRKLKGLTLIWRGSDKPETPSTVLDMFGKSWRQDSFNQIGK
jgi:hypothetical protein